MRFINHAFALAGAVLVMTAAGSANAAWNYQGKTSKPHRMTLEAESQPPAPYTEHAIRQSTVKPFEGGGTTGAVDRSARQQQMAPAYTEHTTRRSTVKPFNPGWAHNKGAVKR